MVAQGKNAGNPVGLPSILTQRKRKSASQNRGSDYSLSAMHISAGAVKIFVFIICITFILINLFRIVRDILTTLYFAFLYPRYLFLVYIEIYLIHTAGNIN